MEMALSNAIFGHFQLLSAKLDTLIQANQGTMLQSHYQRPYSNHEPYNFSTQDGFLFPKPQQQSYEVTHQFQSQRDFPQMEYFNNQGSSSQNQGGPSSPPSLKDENTHLIKQLIEGQKRADVELNKNMEEINHKVEVVFDDINVKFEGLRSRAMELEKKIAQRKSSLESCEEKIFMENPKSYPKDYCCTIEENEDYEKEKFLFEVGMSPMELQELLGHEIRKDVVKRHQRRALNDKLVEDACEKALMVASTQEAKESSKVGDEILSKEGEYMGNGRDHKAKDTTTKVNLNFEVLPYLSQLPFPGRFKKQLLEESYKKYYKDHPTSFDPKLLEIAKENPKLDKFLKDLVVKRVNHEELLRENGILPPNKEEKKLLKLKNPGKFMVPCLLEKIHEEEALVDTGASVNVISLDMIRKYGIKDLIKPTSPIALGDSSVKQPMGKLEDYPLRIGDCIVPTDFVIVEMKSKRKYPLLLGTPFLETVGTKVDFKTKEVILANINPDKSYKMVIAYDEYCGTFSTQGMRDKPMEELDLSESFGWLFERDDNEEESKEAFIGMVKKPKRHRGKKKKAKPQLVVDDEKDFGDYGLNQLFSHQESYVKNGKTPFGTKDTPWMTLIPICYKDGIVEYKIKCKGIPKPFTRARSVIPKEMVDKGQEGMEEIMKNVLKFELVDKGAESLGGSHSTID